MNRITRTGRTFRPPLIPLVVASGLFMDLMDSSALATALPRLSQAFGVDPIDLKLALTAYMLTVAVLVPMSGWLSDRFGAKAVFTTAMGIFVLGSIFCALSNSVAQLVAARVIQGVGGSMMTPVGRSIVVASAPRSDLVHVMGWFTVPAIAGPLIGPPLAGFLLEQASWRWIFLINVPVGMIGMAAVLSFVPRMPRSVGGKFDLPGFLMIAIAITALMVLVETGGLEGQPLSTRLLSFALAAAAVGGYCLYASRRENAVLDLRLLRRDTLLISLVASWLQRMTMGALPFLLPLLLQVGMGLSPLDASDVMLAMACGGLLSRFIVPPLLRRTGFRWSMLLSGAASSLLSAAPALFVAGTPMTLMMIAMGTTSLIRSAFFIPAASLAYIDVSEREIGQATVLFTVAQQLSFAMGVTVAAGLLEASMASGGAMTADKFILPFTGMAGIGALSLVAVWFLRRDAGEIFREKSAGAA